MDKKYTNSGLPVLSEDIVTTKIVEWGRMDSINFIKELDRIKSEDTLTGGLIDQYMNQSTDPTNICMGMVTMYKLLEAQSEAYRLKDQFK